MDREEAILITLQTGVDLLVVTAHSPQLRAQVGLKLTGGKEERDEPLDCARLLDTAYCMLP